MSVLAEEEKSNQALVAAFQVPAAIPPVAPVVRIAQPTVASVVSVANLASSLPSTSLKLASILKKT